MSRRNDCSCCFGILILINLVFIPLSIVYIIKYNDSLEYNKIKCNITEVTYPHQIPTDNDIINNNFVKCNCGKRCVSDLGICNKIYIFDKYEGKILLKEEYTFNTLTCTFREKKCPNGEKIGNRIDAINYNKLEMIKYERFINNDELFNCYEYNGIYFIDNKTNFSTMLIISVITLVLIVLTISIHLRCSTEYNSKI